MKDEKQYKIIVRTLSGRFLTYTVNNYELKDGAVLFTDRVTGEQKVFAISNCEIQEVQ